MTVPAGTFKTYEAVGIREDLEDMIYDISPTETPFLSAVKRMKAKSTLHEWQTDTLSAAGTNAAVEGDDASINTAVPTLRLANRTQILTKAVSISGTEEAVDKAGRESEMAYQTYKRGKELKRDLEFALTRNQAATSGLAASARLMAGIETWIATNKTAVGSGSPAATTPGSVSGAPTTAPTDMSTTGSVSETILKTVIRECWTNGGEADWLLMGPQTKAKLAGFSGIATRFRDVESGKRAQIIGGADLYVSDFGDHKFIPSRFCRDRNVLGLDLEYWGVAYLRPFQTFALAKTGDSEKKQMLVEATLVCKNELANFKITDINPAL